MEVFKKMNRRQFLGLTGILTGRVLTGAPERAAAAGPPQISPDAVGVLVDTTLCIGCRKCATVCPAEAIEGDKKAPHEIIHKRCIQCGACYENCPVDAVDAG